MTKNLKILLIILGVVMVGGLVTLALQSRFLAEDVIEIEKIDVDNYREKEDEEIIQEVMNVIFGNFNEENNQSKWVLNEEEFKKLKNVSPGLADMYKERPLEFSELYVKPITYIIVDDKIYLATATSPQENQNYARTFGAIIGTHLFTTEKGILEEVYSEKVFSEMGSAGFFSEELAETVRISDNDFAFILEPGWTGMGATTVYTVIILFTEGEFREVLEYESFVGHDYLEEDRPEREIVDYSSEIEFIPTEERNFYDIKIHKKGIISQKNKEKEFDDICYYKFEDGLYREVEAL